MNAMMA
jgi:hypothetical protein